jgi:hypothetical protein
LSCPVKGVTTVPNIIIGNDILNFLIPEMFFEFILTGSPVPLPGSKIDAGSRCE